MKKLEITVKIKNEDGTEIVKTISEREVPYIEEFKEQGFRSSFHELETAVLELRKEASDATVSEYLTEISQKKPNLKQEMEKYLKQKNME